MLKTKINTILLCTLFTLFFPLSAGAQYRNPILYADVPDMSVSRSNFLSSRTVMSTSLDWKKATDVWQVLMQEIRMPVWQS